MPNAARHFGDYELLQEIGRGGMGVVYKARQVSLNRLVAVKMIVSGPFASAEAIQRFQAEAEAAASLQHPHIVTIHGLGVHEGLHFFSMDLVDGRSLDKVVATGPLPPELAARYVRAVAEAVHFAHQQGILHRDLKPANILIDDNDQPRITDFGLARRLSDDSELTLTGQVLGSPHYLSPEQARGQRTEVGVTSDVYSLGAILYHLLTGRPPFLGESPPETLWQVVHRDPLPARELNPCLPRDLETICLKCLRKEPAARYASAEALAEDLKRWQSGEPIQARPMRRSERFRRWRRRHPVLAAAGVLGLLALLAGLGDLAWQGLDRRRLQQAPELLYIWIGTDVYLVNAHEGRWRKLPLAGPFIDVSPDHRHLCFMRQEGPEAGALWLSQVDGTGAQRLAPAASSARWLDNHTLIYHRDDLYQVWALDIRTRESRPLFHWSSITSNGYAGSLELSPDRTRLLTNPQNGVFAPTMDLYICDFEGHRLQTVWEDPGNDIEDHHQLWLAGDRLVWCRYGAPGYDLREMAIVTCRLGETNLQALTDWTGLKWPLAGSPDGRQILYLQELHPRGGGMEMMMMNVDGSDRRLFTQQTFSLGKMGDIGARWVGPPHDR